MAIHTFRFETEAEAQAYELGAHFYWSDAPYTTCVNGAVLTVKDDFDGEKLDHVWQWEGLLADPVDVGDNPLISIVNFPTVLEARAFASGVFFFAGAFANVVVFGSSVIIAEPREEGEENDMLVYEYSVLRRLIATHRAQSIPTIVAD